MSDVDRLRAAADELDRDADMWDRDGDSEDRKVAALLRAVAVTQDAYGYRAINAEIIGAANTLADTILGVPNTGGSESGDVPYKNPADEYPREDGWGYG